MKTVKELYDDNSKLRNQCLLGTNNYDWWKEYESNHNEMDSYFRRIYSDFRYFDGDDLTTFKEDVQAILLINRKKYEELYRVYTVSDDIFGIATNYDMKEVMQKENNNEAATISGQRTDINNLQVGSQNTGVVNKRTAFDTAEEKVTSTGTSANGTRNDVTQFTKGQETDTMRGKTTEDYTLTRKGNIGVKDSADILRNAVDFMQSGALEFYKIIFADIYKELLLV